jgi:hypothetical protein
VRADPKPKETAIIESCPGAKTRTRTHRPEIALDSLEGERFQAGSLLPKAEICASDLLDIWRPAVETRQNSGNALDFTEKASPSRRDGRPWPS